MKPAEVVRRGFTPEEVAKVAGRLESNQWKRRLPTVAMMSQTAIGEFYLRPVDYFFFFKQKTAYEIGLGIPAEPLFRSFRLLFLAIIQTFFLISWFSLLLLQLLRHLFYRHLKLHRQRYILIV